MTKPPDPAPDKAGWPFELVLGFTAFAAGAVDVIAFSSLGGVMASAMTGNLALLGYYISRSFVAAAIASIIALLGYAAGSSVATLLSRKRQRGPALLLVLFVECVLLGGAAAVWLAPWHLRANWHREGTIGLLAVAMGFQSIAGKRVNLSNIPTVVFTSTLTNIVIGITETIASGKFTISADTWRQIGSFLLYFCGALCAGFAVELRWREAIFLPFAAAVGAFGAVVVGRKRFFL